MGIAHTRWATHGGKTDANAHPHGDYKDRVALVHNGTIQNCDEIKEELEKTGLTFKFVELARLGVHSSFVRSHTDTEVIAQLIGFYLDQDMEVDLFWSGLVLTLISL